MDPCIESQLWEDFHHAVIEVVRETLIPQTRPRYVVRVEERVYVEHMPHSGLAFIRPAVTVLERTGRMEASEGSAAAAAPVAVAPVILHVPVPERVREAFLTIRERETMEVVTVIEVLSPGNKWAGSDGRREYLRKRGDVLLSATHLVELDLFRGGERLPTIEPLPPGDYYAFVCRRQHRFQAEVYAWLLPQPLPPIPVPLAEADSDIVLDLQTICTTVYDRAGYDYSINYRQPIMPPLNDTEQVWARQILAAVTTPPASA
jgi:hypothetical protein